MNQLVNNLIRRDFDRAASRYEQAAGVQRAAAQEVARLALPYLSAGTRTLDIGSGTGFMAQLLGERTEVTQCDLSHAMCLKSKNISKTVQADMHALPLRDGGFDLVVSSMTLQWSDDFPALWPELLRVARPGAHIVASLPVKPSLVTLRDAFGGGEEAFRVDHFNESGIYINHIDKLNNTIIRSNIIPYTYLYNDFYSLINSVRHIGGSNKRRSSLPKLKRSTLAYIEKNYAERYAVKEQLPLEWHVLYLLVKKHD